MKQYNFVLVLMLWSRESNRRSGIATAMRHRLFASEMGRRAHSYGQSVNQSAFYCVPISWPVPKSWPESWPT